MICSSTCKLYIGRFFLSLWVQLWGLSSHMPLQREVFSYSSKTPLKGINFAVFSRMRSFICLIFSVYILMLTIFFSFPMSFHRFLKEWCLLELIALVLNIFLEHDVVHDLIFLERFPIMPLTTAPQNPRAVGSMTFTFRYLLGLLSRLGCLSVCHYHKNHPWECVISCIYVEKDYDGEFFRIKES